MDKRPLLAITMGDAAGIGPEVAAKTLAEPHIYEISRPLVIGSEWAMREALKLVPPAPDRPPLVTRAISSPEEAKGDPEFIDVLDLHNLAPAGITMGRHSAACGRACVEWVEEAARLCLSGRLDGMVTCPINKESVHLAGYPEEIIGHQEILGRLTNATNTATMLIAGTLRVAHLSTHKPLKVACEYVRKPNVVAKLTLTHECLEQWGIARPRIAVAALNPHGGEGGLLGREEIDEIAPAVVEARERGIDARGPYPADSVFYRAIAGEFDAVLAMYHDQGHIAIKVHNFEESTTVTMGIPLLRTSVDHGTAFDIAGKGIANHISLVKAVEAAAQLATRKLAEVRS